MIYLKVVDEKIIFFLSRNVLGGYINMLHTSLITRVSSKTDTKAPFEISGVS